MWQNLAEGKGLKILVYSSSCKCVVHENINDHEKIECPVCNSEIELYWEPRYRGIRGKCTKCGTNWAESWISARINTKIVVVMVQIQDFTHSHIWEKLGDRQFCYVCGKGREQIESWATVACKKHRGRVRILRFDIWRVWNSSLRFSYDTCWSTVNLRSCFLTSTTFW